MPIEARDIPEVIEQLVEGTARLQARHDMLECFVRAVLSELQPSHLVIWKVLEAARAEWDQRQISEGMSPLMELDTAALGLWNELRDACLPPARPLG